MRLTVLGPFTVRDGRRNYNKDHPTEYRDETGSFTN